MKKHLHRCNLVLLFASILFVLMFAISMPVKAQIVNAEDARQTAIAFLASKQSSSSMRKAKQLGSSFASSLSNVTTISDNGEPAIHIFNRESGGYIIVSGEMGTLHKILAYSDSGEYDPNNIPIQMQDVIDGYIFGISRLRKASVIEDSVVKRNLAMDKVISTANAYSNSNQPDYVNPLLGEIVWGQDEPYNLMTPTYEGKNGLEHYPTGCVATAVAQIMKYHEWPMQGRGSFSYLWKGQLLGADFSKSIYQWDLMSPTYDSNQSYSEAQKNAVALLMHDVGIASTMEYEENGSSTCFVSSHMPEFFDYDMNMRTLSSSYCSTEDWEGVLRDELANGRPVLCTGGQSLGDAGHAFVCDGYDTDGLFHYNFGWSGYSNGWFVSSATGWDTLQKIDYGIQKNNGGIGAPSAYSETDFRWDAKSKKFLGQLHIECTGVDDANSGNRDLGLAVHNANTGNVVYYTIQTWGGLSGYINVSTIDFDEYLPDGQYYVYPVTRVNKQEWYTFFHNPSSQIVVDLTVKKGEKTWENNNLVDATDEDIIEVNGVYYTIDTSTQEASIDRKNKSGNSYSGVVNLPDDITYNGQTYPVTSISSYAFEYCSNLTSVHIGKNVQKIEYAAFNKSNIESVTFEEGSKLQEINEYVFNECKNLKELTLPDEVKSIGLAAFQGCTNLINIVLPDGIESIGEAAFNASGLKKIILPEGTSIGRSAFAQCRSLEEITLPKVVESIARSTFIDCSNLKIINIPAGVKSIDMYAFSDCINLSQITCSATTAPSVYEESFENISKTGTLIVPMGADYSSWLAILPVGWTIKYDETLDGRYKITYFVEDEVYKTDSIAYGTVITPEAEPVKEGYTFSGWSEIPAMMPNQDVEVYGSFTKNKYTIRFVNEDGAELQSSEIEYGEIPVYTGTTPTKTASAEYSYTFADWSPQIVEVTANATYTATYTNTPNEYLLTYNVDGAVYAEYTLPYGAAITPEADPTKEGYVFSGWSEIPATMPDHDVEVSGSFILSGISYIYNDKDDTKEYYTLDGNRVDNIRQGIYIVRKKK